MKVAFIDTILTLNEVRLSLTTKVINLIDDKKDEKEEDSHSAICLKLFEDSLNESNICEIYLYTVLNDYHKGNVEKVIEALDLCISDQVDIINMSIGTTDSSDGKIIEKKIQDVLARGIKVVAAVSNSGEYTYPASCAGTIGVMHNIRCLIRGMISEKKNEAGELISVCAPNKVNGRHGDISIRICNSFATPLVTAHIVNEFIK